MILKIDRGSLELKGPSGNHIRTLATTGVVDADINSTNTLILITFLNGKVELVKDNGAHVRTLVLEHGLGARFNGADITIRLDNGRTELLKENGAHIRYI